MEPHERLEVVGAANELLAALSISSKPIESVLELHSNASSMFVAIFEKIYDCRIDKICRRPLGPQDYEHNADLVINALKPRVADPVSLAGIAGNDLCGEAGSADATFAIARLVEIFVAELGGTFGSDDAFARTACGRPART